MTEAGLTPADAGHEPSRPFRWSAVLIGLGVDLAITIVVGNVVGGVYGFRAAFRTGGEPVPLATLMSAVLTREFLLITTTLGLVASAAGGFTTALLSRAAPLRHALVTGLLATAFTVPSLVFLVLIRAQPGLPLPVLAALSACTAVAAVLGALPVALARRGRA